MLTRLWFKYPVNNYICIHLQGSVKEIKNVKQLLQIVANFTVIVLCIGRC